MDLLLMGASVRAAAASLRRIGGRPIAFDLYGDLDLAAIAESTLIPAAEYPRGIEARLADLPSLPWMYTGAIENEPELIDSIARRHRLIGNGGAIVRRVKDPFLLAEAVRGAGLDTPRIARTPDRLPPDGTWLAKPFQSGGGDGIKPWRGADSPDPGRVFYQERVAGISGSALFVRSGETTRLAGVSRQYLGRPGQRFAYRGSLGPWPTSVTVEQTINRLGAAVGESFGLTGLFGLDLILAGEQVWLIEVNPRYTAAVEVLELALGRSLLADHLRAFGEPMLLGPTTAAPSPFVGKAILFATSTCHLGTAVPLPPASVLIPPVADIPPPGTAFAIGQPIMTVFGTGRTPDACRLDLARRVRFWRRTLDLRPRSADLTVDHQEERHREEENS